MKGCWKKIGNGFKKLFGGIEMTWPKTIIFAVVMGVYTALMAMLVPDGNSFHAIAVTGEVWLVLGLIVAINCKKPLEAGLKTFVFFLISQPLVYLFQVPFNDMGWGLFYYYRFWIIPTILTFPAGIMAWRIRKGDIWSSLILSAGVAALAVWGVLAIFVCVDSFPNHLLLAVFCLGMIPVLILTLLKDVKLRLIAGAIGAVAFIVCLVIKLVGLSQGWGTDGLAVFNLSEQGFDTNDGWTLMESKYNNVSMELSEIEGYDYDGNPTGKNEYLLRARFNATGYGEYNVGLMSKDGVERKCTIKLIRDSVNEIDCGR